MFLAFSSRWDYPRPVVGSCGGIASITAAGSLTSADKHPDCQSPKMEWDANLQSSCCGLAVLIHSVKMFNLGSFP